MKKLLLSACAALLLCCGKASAQMRIVSLLPSHTEILFALNASEVVAVSNFCDYPPQVAGLERAGDYYSPNIEKIISLNPSVVFTGSWKNSSGAQRLRRAGIKVVQLEDARNIAGIYAAIRLIGHEVGRDRQAEKLVKELSAKVSAISAKAARRKNRPRVYVEVDSPHWTIGGASFLNDVLEKAGGTNIFADLKEPYAKVSWESVVRRKPDVILSLARPSPDYSRLPGADMIPAVVKKRIISGLDKDIMTRPSPRIYAAVQMLAKALDE